MKYKYYGCSNLESVTIPDNVAEIDGLFEGCTNLSTVTFGSGVTRVFGEETFKGCPNLRKIIIESTRVQIWTLVPNLQSA